VNAQAQACLQALKQAQRVLIAGHINPDADALGSALALASALQQMGKTARIVLPPVIPASLVFLPLTVFAWSEKEAPFDLGVALDTPVWDRLGPACEPLKACPQLIAIDHHPGHALPTAVSWVDPSAAATAQLCVELVDALGVPLHGDIALGLYAGLVDDTGGFRHSNTTAACHCLAARLLEAGVDAAWVSQRLFDSCSTQAMQLLGLALAKTQLGANGQWALACLTLADFSQSRAREDEASRVIDFVRAQDGVDLAAVLREGADGKHRLSMRSRNGKSASAVAAPFGGGGHACAAGATLSGDFTHACAQVRAALDAACQGAAF
jgi:phosphoesterase RecJ-like protein